MRSKTDGRTFFVVESVPVDRLSPRSEEVVAGEADHWPLV
jgi:hypothetical protein